MPARNEAIELRATNEFRGAVRSKEKRKDRREWNHAEARDQHVYVS
jgi:hypothetical protein